MWARVVVSKYFVSLWFFFKRFTSIWYGSDVNAEYTYMHMPPVYIEPLQYISWYQGRYLNPRDGEGGGLNCQETHNIILKL